MRKLIGVLCAVIITCISICPINVHAEGQGPVWTSNGGNTWTYTDGQSTNLTAKIINDTLYITGTGAVPAYGKDCLGNRPWHNSAVTVIVIYNGIASVGAEAFSNIKTVRQVTIPASVYVEDATAFGGLSEDCLIYIQGIDMISRDIGTIPYNSLDSMVPMMKQYSSYKFQLENYYMIGLAQNDAGGILKNLIPRDAQGKSHNEKYPLYDLSSALTVANNYGQETGSLTINCRQQGVAAMEAFSLVIGDNQYVASYNMSMSNRQGVVKHTDAPMQYTMAVPVAYQYPGRQFTLIQLGNGVINMLADEDTNDATVTFTTDYISTAYALVYTDMIQVQ